MEKGKPARLYVLVPEELEDELLEPLQEHYRDDPTVEAIPERRRMKRRSGVDRRLLRMGSTDERRRSESDRRQLADRRAPLLPRDLTEDLPPELAEYASVLRWAQRLDPVTPHHAALPTPALVEAVAAGHQSCATELYWRCYERIYTQLRAYMPARSADGRTKAAFGYLLDRIGEYDPSVYTRSASATPFDHFLEEIVAEYAEANAATHLF